MKLLITGVAGFIGFHTAKSYLDDNFNVCGIDNMNDYYDTDLKKDRLDLLNSYSKFKFSKIDISNIKQLDYCFRNFMPDKVIHLAAQAGVRYSIKNPLAYLDSNIIGFMNIIEMCRKFNIEGLIYASSSSVYGKNKKIPFNVEDRVDTPLSIYAASKLTNELIAYSYSNLYGLHSTALRFFTVYGPWGRPDMAYYDFTKKIYLNEEIEIFNNGNMKRDFTYIADIVDGIKSAVIKNYKCEIFNLGNNQSEKLMDLVRYIEENTSKKARIKFLPMQLGDVKITYANIDKTKKMLNFKPKISLKNGINEFVSWYENYERR